MRPSSLTIKTKGVDVKVDQSHGGSSAQARAVNDGLEADVVTMNTTSDVDFLAANGVVAKDWAKKFPHNAAPTTSTMLFLTRNGNPKGIKDWPDLVKPNIEIITPSPKTSGNGKLAFLAAWGSVILSGGTEDQAKEFVTQIYQRTPTLEAAARGATTTFAQKGQGDVHLTWENEAHLEVQESKGDLEIVYPSRSFLAEPHVAVVDENTGKKGTSEVAEAYLKFLYTPEGQEIIAKHFYRPTNAEVLARHSQQFPEIKLFSISEISKGWDDAQARFFAEGALFDTIYQSK